MYLTIEWTYSLDSILMIAVEQSLHLQLEGELANFVPHISTKGIFLVPFKSQENWKSTKWISWAQAQEKGKDNRNNAGEKKWRDSCSGI